MQILRAYNNELISEIALQCGDPTFVDFDKDIYAQSVFRAQRLIAVNYSILDFNIGFIVEESDLKLEWLPLDLPNMKEETEVWINEELYRKTNEYTKKMVTMREGYDPKERTKVSEKEYRMKWGAIDETVDKPTMQWLFRYVYPTEGDKIVINYVSTGSSAEHQTGNLIIPEKYYEKVIEEAIKYIAKLGIAKYRSEKKEKYIDLLRLNNTSFDPNLARTNSWITMKPFIYP